MKQFEAAIRAKGLTPVHLIVARGCKVKWFACKDTRPGAMYSLVVYDSQGKAMVLPDCQDQDGKNGELLIETPNGGVRINGQVPYRDTCLDIE
ncbi:MAG: hypothetical protein IJT98_03500 [Prevotella sp.]|nr:hypothetical protein [Prevotella sp.]